MNAPNQTSLQLLCLARDNPVLIIQSMNQPRITSKRATQTSMTLKSKILETQLKLPLLQIPQLKMARKCMLLIGLSLTSLMKFLDPLTKDGKEHNSIYILDLSTPLMGLGTISKCIPFTCLLLVSPQRKAFSLLLWDLFSPLTTTPQILHLPSNKSSTSSSSP